MRTNGPMMVVNHSDSVIGIESDGQQTTQTTHIYEHADPALKERAIARTAPLRAKPGRYRPPDELLAFLEGL